LATTPALYSTEVARYRALIQSFFIKVRINRMDEPLLI
jgi:hypothetical protein